MKRLFLLIVFLVVSIQSDAAKMSSYTNNTTPNGDVYFVGVDPNDISQTANGSNYRYSLNSILNLGLLDAVFNSLSIAGTGDSWIELENNTSFSDSIAGKYGLRFYNGALQQIINGTATDIGSASVIQRSSDPVYTDLSAGQIAVSTSSGDLFIKTSTGMYTFAGTYAADPTTPTLVSMTIPAAGTTAEGIFSEAMSIGAGGSGGWTLNDPTVAMTYTSGAGIVGDPAVFSLARTVLSTATENPTVSYTQPTNGFESADDGTDLAPIPNVSVVNNSTQTGSPYTTVFSDDFNRADNTNVITGSGWTSETDTGSIMSILNNALNVSYTGAGDCRITKTISSNNTDYQYEFKIKISSIHIASNIALLRPLYLYTAAGVYLSASIISNESGDAYQWSFQVYNDAGTPTTYTYNKTFLADTYQTLQIQSDVGVAATPDGILKIIVDGSTALELTGRSDETRPVLSEIRSGLPYATATQAISITCDDATLGYK